MANKRIRKKKRTPEQRIVDQAKKLIAEIEKAGFDMETEFMKTSVDVVQYHSDPKIYVKHIINGWEVSGR